MHLRQIVIHEHVHVFKQHTFMKLKINWILERLLYGFQIKNKSSTSMDEVKNYEKNGRIMKLQEKYWLITRRVLNPNANPCVGSKIIFIILQLVQNAKEELFSSEKFKGTMSLDLSFQKNWKVTMNFHPNKRRSSAFKKVER